MRPRPRRGREVEENTELFELFEQMDVDGSGGLDEQELMELMEGLGQKLDREGAARLMAEMDDDGNGTIEFGEFRTWFLSHAVTQSNNLEFQRRREKAARYSKTLGVRAAPTWVGGQNLSKAEREGFSVPAAWEKRIAVITAMGCSRTMAVDALRETNGHGGKARAKAAASLHVGPASLVAMRSGTVQKTDEQMRQERSN